MGTTQHPLAPPAAPCDTKIVKNLKSVTYQKLIWHIVLVVVIVVVLEFAPDEASPPLFAIISVTALSIRAMGSDGDHPILDTLVQFIGLAVAYTAGLLSGWSWLEAEDVSLVWYLLGAALAFITGMALLTGQDSLVKLLNRRNGKNRWPVEGEKDGN